MHTGPVTSTDPVRVPSAEFAGDEFWRRLNRLADDRGHQGHPRWLVGEIEQLNRYRLLCSQCDVVVVEMMVDLEPTV